MGGDEKDRLTVRNPFHRFFQASLLLLGAVIALNLTIAFLRPLLPWIVGSIGLVTVAWLVIAFVR